VNQKKRENIKGNEREIQRMREKMRKEINRERQKEKLRKEIKRERQREK